MTVEPSLTDRSRPPLLCLGCPRTGTASLAEALQTLGYQRIHHGVKTVTNSPEWEILDRASDATFPVLPSYTNEPFTRQDWDEWCKHWDVVTDMASFFAPSLISAYPDAKVILVERDFDSWFKSWTTITKLWASSPAKMQAVIRIERRCSMKPGIVSAKFTQGWIGSTKVEDMLDRDTVKQAVDRHYAYIRATVPPAQLLNFKLKDGWEPLCEFLKRPVPDQPFPHVNESAEYERIFKLKRNENFKRLAKTFLPGGKEKVALANQRERAALVKALENGQVQDTVVA